MVRITGIAPVMERLGKAVNDADLGLNLTKEEDTAIAAQCAAVEISWQVSTGKGCTGQHNLRLLGHE